MAKKKFEQVNTDNIYADQIADATAEPAEPSIPRQKQGEQPTQEIVNMAREQGKTQGRAGCKALRINVAFDPENYEYIRTMARVRGETMTAFINHIIKQSIEDHAEVYQQALKFKESL